LFSEHSGMTRWGAAGVTVMVTVTVAAVTVKGGARLEIAAELR